MSVSSQTLKIAQVILRFVLRLIVIVTFAAIANIGFSKSIIALLWMSAVLSVLAAGLRREPFFGDDINYWDEATVYAALCCLSSAIANAPAKPEGF